MERLRREDGSEVSVSICEEESATERRVSFPPAAMEADGSMDPSAMSCEEEVFISHQRPHGNRHSPIRMSVPPVGETLGAEEEGEEEYDRDKEAEERRGSKRGERC